MKAIQLLRAAATVAAVAGADHRSRDHRRRRLRRLQDQDGTAPLPPQNVTCLPDETPCGTEIGTTVTCAPPGGTCPCYFDELRCSDPHFGEYCDTVCCEWGKEERCHLLNPKDPNYYDVWCAKVSSGGCPCPEGETKCGVSTTADGGVMGYCTTMCCDGDDKQTCYDDDYEPSFCALIAEGGCPCPEGKEKCGATEDWAGYCTEVCCGEDEEACYYAGGTKSCSKEGCSGEKKSHGYWMPHVKSTILKKGSGGQVSYYREIARRREELLARATSTGGKHIHLLKSLEEEEAALFHAVRLREEKRRRKSEAEELFSVS